MADTNKPSADPFLNPSQSGTVNPYQVLTRLESGPPAKTNQFEETFDSFRQDALANPAQSILNTPTIETIKPTNTINPFGPRPYFPKDHYRPVSPNDRVTRNMKMDEAAPFSLFQKYAGPSGDPVNVRAFTIALAKGEGSLNPDGSIDFKTLVNDSQNKKGYHGNFSKHPNVRESTQYGPSSAFGFTQFIKGTWDRVSNVVGVKDITPKSQVEATLQLMKETGAIAFINKGDLKGAMNAAGNEWASMSPHFHQHNLHIDEAVKVYRHEGGLLAKDMQPHQTAIASSEPKAGQQKPKHVADAGSEHHHVGKRGSSHVRHHRGRMAPAAPHEEPSIFSRIAHAFDKNKAPAAPHRGSLRSLHTGADHSAHPHQPKPAASSPKGHHHDHQHSGRAVADKGAEVKTAKVASTTIMRPNHGPGFF